MDWQIVNDGVMGGLSEGRVDFAGGEILRFSGTLSLENNGGFTTVRSGDLDLDLSNDLGLLLRVKGDGRTYEARLDSDARFRGNSVSFAGTFETEKDRWIQVKVPFTEFKGSFRGMDLPDMKLNPAAVERVWILLADKKEGPFELEVDWIRTYGKGQGSLTGRTGSTVPPTRTREPGENSLIGTIVADGRFTILRKALDTAGLTPFFQWDNPLTVIAPTDEAFARLPEDLLDDLLQPENKEKLIKILSYHVASGRQDVASALQQREIETVEGSPLTVSFADGRVRLNDATVLDGNVEASDGIIHIIDKVLLPEAPVDETLVGKATEAGNFSTLLAAVEAADLTGILRGDGPFTVLAPTDEAFRALPDGTVERLLEKENREELLGLLNHHVFKGRISAGDALNAGTADSLAGKPVSFSIENGRLAAGGSTVLTVDVEASNGLIHVVDSVLVPPAPASSKGLQSGTPGKETSGETVAADTNR